MAEVLKTLVACRLIDPASEWRLHRQWFDASAMAVDVLLPTTDGRELTLSSYTQPEAEHRMPLEQPRLELPRQPPPKIMAALLATKAAEPAL